MQLWSLERCACCGTRLKTHTVSLQKHASGWSETGLQVCWWSSEKQTQSNPKTLDTQPFMRTSQQQRAAFMLYYAMSSINRTGKYFMDFKHCKLKDKANYSYRQILSSTHLYHEFSSAEHKIAILILIFWRMLVTMLERWSHQTVDGSHWLTL